MSGNEFSESVKKLDEIGRSEVAARIERVENSPWRQNFHVQPVFGDLGHPTVFVHHEHAYHVFYQWFPLGADKNIPYWYHVTSHDLSLFENKGLFIKPDMLYDDAGALSGTVFPVDDELNFFYLGLRKKDGKKLHSLVSGVMNERGKFIKDTSPIDFEGDEHHLQKLKDPSLWQKGTELYMLLAGKNEDDYGRIGVYVAEDETFTFKGELTTGFNEFGYQWEFPDICTVDGQMILSFCPKGVDKYLHHFHNVYQAGYIIGDIDFDNLTMLHGPFEEFDYGFDFYAPNMTVGPKGKTYLIGWMGMKNSVYPTDKYGWRHCLTVPRELSIKNNRLYQTPAPSLELLREGEIQAEGYITHFPHKMRDFNGSVYEMIIDIEENNASILYIKLRMNHREETVLKYNSEEQSFTLDRTFSGELPDDVDGTERTVHLEEDLYQVRIYMDVSSIEVFLNEGLAVMTSRIFPSENATGVELSTETGECQTKITQYQLKKFSHEPEVYKK